MIPSPGDERARDEHQAQVDLARAELRDLRYALSELADEVRQLRKVNEGLVELMVPQIMATAVR